MKKAILVFPLFFLFFSNLSEAQTAPKAPIPIAEFSDILEGLHYAIIRLKPIILDPLNTERPDLFKNLREVISTFNMQFEESALRISQIYLLAKEGKEPVLTIRRFIDYQEAKTYVQALEKVVKNVEDGLLVVEALPISQVNYRNVLRRKSAVAYSKYHQKRISK